MKVRFLTTVFMPLLLVSLLGCASATKTYQSEIVKGETYAGMEIGFIYDVSKEPGSSGMYLLARQSYCAEEVEELALTRERSQDAKGAAAVVLAPLGIIFPRIGQPLIFSGLEKSRGERAESVGVMTTGRIIPCSEFEPAANVPLMLQTSEMDIIKGFQTNAQGMIQLDKIIAAAANALYVNVFVDNKGSAFYIGTVQIR